MSEDAIQRRIDHLIAQIGAMQENINELNALTGNTDDIKSVERYGDPAYPNFYMIDKANNDEQSPNGMTRSVRNAYISLYVHKQEITKLGNEIEALTDFISSLVGVLGVSKALPLRTIKQVAQSVVEDIEQRFDDADHTKPLVTHLALSNVLATP